MHRFFLAQERISNNIVIFPQETVHQIRNVLRLKLGNIVLVLDNKGDLFEVKLQSIELETAHGEILSKRKAEGEPRIFLSLYVSLIQRDKFEFILQKCTEAGVGSFMPFISRYSLVRNSHMSASRKIRWERILKEAAEQSGRGVIPILSPVQHLNQAIETACAEHAVYLATWEGEKRYSLTDVILPVREKMKAVSETPHITLFIGPEGGFMDSEVQMFHERGIKTFSLGERILRMETAAIIAPALILYELGDLNPLKNA